MRGHAWSSLLEHYLFYRQNCAKYGVLFGLLGIPTVISLSFSMSSDVQFLVIGIVVFLMIELALGFFYAYHHRTVSELRDKEKNNKAYYIARVHMAYYGGKGTFLFIFIVPLFAVCGLMSIGEIISVGLCIYWVTIIVFWGIGNGIIQSVIRKKYLARYNEEYGSEGLLNFKGQIENDKQNDKDEYE